ncbi:MAG: hypothetical protein LBQ49_00245 [Rickettsiales bacterium]|jgi:hypothetical protein|nr:hypothetical protein [Rickettsiales bacterium]
MEKEIKILTDSEKKKSPVESAKTSLGLIARMAKARRRYSSEIFYLYHDSGFVNCY